MSNWEEVPINSVCELIVDCLNRTAPVVDFETEYKMIRTTNVRDGQIDLNGARSVTAGTFKLWNRRTTPRIGDIVLTREAPHGEIGRIRTTDKVFLGQRTMLFRADAEKCDAGFLYYSLLTDFCQNQLESFASGSTVLHIKVPDAKKLKVRLPSLPLQRRIASSLDNYNTLLDNYLLQVAALEELAKELYQEWFMRGRCPSSEAGANGELPTGWEVQRLGDVIELKYGKALIAEDRAGGKFPVVGSSGIVDFHDEPLVNRPGIVVGRKGNVGSVFWLDKPFYPIDTAFYVDSELSPFYLFYNLQQQNFISGDSAVPGLNREQALGNKIVVPSADSLAQFDKIVDAIFKKISNLRHQIELLRTTRDALLPRLMSGQLTPSSLSQSA